MSRSTKPLIIPGHLLQETRTASRLYHDFPRVGILAMISVYLGIALVFLFAPWLQPLLWPTVCAVFVLQTAGAWYTSIRWFNVEKLVEEWNLNRPQPLES